MTRSLVAGKVYGRRWVGYDLRRQYFVYSSRRSNVQYGRDGSRATRREPLDGVIWRGAPARGTRQTAREKRRRHSSQSEERRWLAFYEKKPPPKKKKRRRTRAGDGTGAHPVQRDAWERRSIRPSCAVIGPHAARASFLRACAPVRTPSK